MVIIFIQVFDNVIYFVIEPADSEIVLTEAYLGSQLVQTLYTLVFARVYRGIMTSDTVSLVQFFAIFYISYSG